MEQRTTKIEKKHTLTLLAIELQLNLFLYVFVLLLLLLLTLAVAASIIVYFCRSIFKKEKKMKNHFYIDCMRKK